MSDLNPALKKNVLSTDVEIKGSLSFEEVLSFDGKLEGEISSKGVLTIGPNAIVKGEIKTQSVIIRGTVEGNVTVTDRCELRGNAKLHGDLSASSLVMEENVTMIGQINVSPAESEAGVIRPFAFVKQAITGGL